MAIVDENSTGRIQRVRVPHTSGLEARTRLNEMLLDDFGLL